MHTSEIIQLRRWTTPTRYYRVLVQQNLFGNWELVRAWGGVGTKFGRLTVQPAVDYDQAVLMLEGESRRRGQRGYVRADDVALNALDRRAAP
jgi:predicted DNA-binding WGR domain protein